MKEKLWVGFACDTNKILCAGEDYADVQKSGVAWAEKSKSTFYMRLFEETDDVVNSEPDYPKQLREIADALERQSD